MWVTVPFLPSSLISCNDQQAVSDSTLFFCQAISSCISCNDQQFVGDSAPFCPTVSFHLIPWPIECEWQCLVSAQQSHYISSHDKQYVSDCTFSLPSSLITSTNSLWVTVPPFCPTVLFYLIPWPIACEWQCPLFCPAVLFHLIPWPIGCEWWCPLFCPAVSLHLIP